MRWSMLTLLAQLVSQILKTFRDGGGYRPSTVALSENPYAFRLKVMRNIINSFQTSSSLNPRHRSSIRLRADVNRSSTNLRHRQSRMSLYVSIAVVRLTVL